MKLRILTLLFCSALLINTASAQYQRTDLASNQPGVAPTTDPRLVNAWGLVANPASPWWVSDNGTGFSTLYNGAGQQIPLFVTVPPAPSSPAGTLGTPTGIVGNTNAAIFTITENNVSAPSIFIFATLDGLIVGWNPTIGGATGDSHATIAVDRSSAGAVYTGLTIATNQAGQTFLYAADAGPNGRVDIFDGGFNLVKSFDDPAIPKSFTPYGIQTINGKIWVTFAAPPPRNAQGGFVDVFDTEGNLVKHFAAQGPLHLPWGIALAPADFGPMSNAILISNNISRGRINAFNPETGQFLGPLRDANGETIEVDHIWALQFGHDTAANGAHNQLFFTAGPNDYANGLFGVITVGP
jgi:uncharacterized protein (TIGR03118 family)